MKKIIMNVGILLILSACGNEEVEPKKNDVTISQSSPDVYAKFQNIDIQINQNQAEIVGDANASDDEFYYTVEQGEKTLEKEQVVQLNGKWSGFEIRVNITEEMVEAEDVVIVTMYNKDDDGSVVNPNYIPLDLDVQQQYKRGRGFETLILVFKRKLIRYGHVQLRRPGTSETSLTS